MTEIYLMTSSELYDKDNIITIHNSDSKTLINEKAFLSVSGEKKAEEISKNKELQGFDAIYSSSYIRTLETAKYMALENNTVIHVDDRFNERKVGDLAPMEITELRVLQAKNFDFKLPNGESLNEAKKRIQKALKELLNNEKGNKVLIVSHPTIITALLSTWCEVGYNFDYDIILSYDNKAIIDGNFSFSNIIKLDFDDTNLINVDSMEL